MKRATITGAIVLILALFPAYGTPRLSLGIGAPLAAAYTSNGELTANTVFPLPMAHVELGYAFPLGPMSLNAGARSLCYLVGTSFGAYAWPNLTLERRMGALILEARLGGGALAGYADSGFSFTVAPIFLPDLSFWWGIGPRARFRLGGGFFGKLSFGDGSSAMGGLADGVLFYVGIKTG
jgi:hypothetical protein